MSSNIPAHPTRPTTPTPSSEVILARAMRRATLEKGWAPTRKSNRKNLPLRTVPSVLTRRLPSGGLAYGMFPSKEAQRQALFELDIVTACEENGFDEGFDEELIDYLEEEEIVEEPLAKRPKMETPQ